MWGQPLPAVLRAQLECATRRSQSLESPAPSHPRPPSPATAQDPPAAALNEFPQSPSDTSPDSSVPAPSTNKPRPHSRSNDDAGPRRPESVPAGTASPYHEIPATHLPKPHARHRTP